MPVASYVPFVISGKLVFVSGQIPLGPEGPAFISRLGANMAVEDGQAAAKLCALNLLAQLKAACGGRFGQGAALRAAWRFVNADA